MGPTTRTLSYPHISPSRLRHGTQVYCYATGQSRIYTIPYPHSADYMAITLPKGTLWGHGALTLWYITIHLDYAIIVLWYVFRLIYTPPNSPCMHTMYNLQYNVMVPSIHSISVTSWYPSILLWYGSVSHVRHALLPHSSLHGHSPT